MILDIIATAGFVVTTEKLPHLLGQKHWNDYFRE
jgi:hypothetical protein